MFDLRGLVLLRTRKHQRNYPHCCTSHWHLRHNFGIHLDCSGHILPDGFVISYYMIGFGSHATNNCSDHTHCITTGNSLVETIQD